MGFNGIEMGWKWDNLWLFDIVLEHGPWMIHLLLASWSMMRNDINYPSGNRWLGYPRTKWAWTGKITDGILNVLKLVEKIYINFYLYLCCLSVFFSPSISFSISLSFSDSPLSVSLPTSMSTLTNGVTRPSAPGLGITFRILHPALPQDPSLTVGFVGMNYLKLDMHRWV